MFAGVKIVKEPLSIAQRLADFGTTLDEWRHVVRVAVNARREILRVHPPGSDSSYAYIQGTGAIRQLLMPKGWEMEAINGVCATFDPQQGIRIIFQNADSACIEGRDPRSVNDKGAASERAVSSSCGFLFPYMEEEQRKRQNASVWYLFVHANGDDVRAELSCPKAIIDGQFEDFHERIFLIQHGEWDGPSVLKSDISPPGQYEVAVTRK